MASHTIKKITLFKNAITQYDVLHHFRDSLAAALERAGVKTSVIDIRSHTPSTLIKALYSDYPDYTLSFNELELLADGSYLSDNVHIPHVSWFVDSAHYFYARVYSSTNILITPDQTSEMLLKKWGAERVFFLPHAFDKALTADLEHPRQIPIAFCGTFIDPMGVEELWKTYLPPKIRESLMAASSATLENIQLPYQEAFTIVKEDNQDYFANITADEEVSLVRSLDNHVRGKDRMRLLKDLERLPVHIFGKNASKRTWNDFLNMDQGNYTIHPAVGFPEALAIMKNAQIILNSSPMFKNGAHERIFYGLGLGAGVLTNETVWSKDHFSDEELVFYPSSDPKGVVEQVKELLSQPQRLREMVAKGQQKVLQEHTWDVRAQQLLGILEESGLHNG